MQETDNSARNSNSNNGRAVMLLIAGIPVTIILLSTWLWYYVIEGNLDIVGALGTANHGVLLDPPRQIADYPVFESTDLPFRYTGGERQWTFLVPGDGSCDVQCENMLYTTRQIHIALGKEFNRIRRLYVGDTALAETALEISELSDGSPAPGSFSDYLATEQRGMRGLFVAPAKHAEMLAEYQLDQSTWYLVDPAGWIMMSYNSSNDYKGVISDLKFLLKNSSD